MLSKRAKVFAKTGMIVEAYFLIAEKQHMILQPRTVDFLNNLPSEWSRQINTKGWTRDESLAIFRFLTKHLTKDEFVTRFKWQPGSLAMWDNRCMFHNALNDYQGHRRHMHRVIVKGDRPQ